MSGASCDMHLDFFIFFNYSNLNRVPLSLAIFLKVSNTLEMPSLLRSVIPITGSLSSKQEYNWLCQKESNLAYGQFRH